MQGEHMKLIFCLDDRGGMMFNNRRQSQDRVLRARVIAMLGDSRLIISPYSAKQFTEDGNIVVSQNPMKSAKENDFYFVEDLPYSLSDTNGLVIYRWNRHYPSDVTFNGDIKKLGFVLKSSEDFEGSSHEKITEEIYIKA